MARITVASAKAKARRLQQLVASDFSEITGIPWGKDEAIASREMGQSGTDIRLIGEAKRLLDVAVECKAQEKWSIHEFIKQARANLEGMSDWVVIARKSREKAIALMSGEYWYKLPDDRNFKLPPGKAGKAWKLDSWISDNRKVYPDQPWVQSVRNKESELFIFMEYELYLNLLRGLVDRRRR